MHDTLDLVPINDDHDRTLALVQINSNDDPTADDHVPSVLLLHVNDDVDPSKVVHEHATQ